MKIETVPKITAGAIGIVALANRGKVRDLYDLGEQLLDYLNGSDLGV